MKKGFLIKNIIKLIFIILFIYIEVTSELEIPKKVSNIINIGVVQSGIDEKIPRFIRKSQMDLLLKLTNEDESILDNYELIKKENTQKLNENNLKSVEDVYILKENVSKDLEDLIKDTLKNFVALQNKNNAFEVAFEIQNNVTQDQLNSINKKYNFGENLIDIVEELPTDLQTKIIKIVNKRANEIDNTVFNQSINKLIVEEYKTLGIDVSKIQRKYNLNQCKEIFIIVILALVGETVGLALSTNLSANISKEYRRKLSEKILKISEDDLNKIGKNKIHSTIINSTKQIEMNLPLIIQNLVSDPMYIIKGLLIILSKNNYSMIIVSVGAIGFAILDIIILMIAIIPNFKKSKNISDLLKNRSMNLINGAYVIRSFNKALKEEKEFENLSEKSEKKNTVLNTIMGFIVPTILFVVEFTVIYIVYLGAKQIDGGIMNAGDIVEFMQITIQMIIAFLGLSILGILIPECYVAKKDIGSILKLCEQTHLGEKSINSLNNKKIVFENISFERNNKKILENINFTIEPGKVNAIIGETGSGKTSIINLLLQAYKPTSGIIKIEDTDIMQYNINDLNKLISVVFQRNGVFSGTLENNFKLFNNGISKKDMYKVCDLAELNDFIIDGNKEKLDFQIINGGANISGGQKQRISIANALVKDWDILILDDSFSSLDNKTESLIRNNIYNEFPNKTIIIISQKVNTIKDSENIIVMKGGKILDQGNHRYLKDNCKEYNELIKIQNRKEEF